MTKLIGVIGITGNQTNSLFLLLKIISTDSRNQGSSVASAFLKGPSWKIRGTSRDPSKPSSQALVAIGIEIVPGDVGNVAS